MPSSLLLTSVLSVLATVSLGEKVVQDYSFTSPFNNRNNLIIYLIFIYLLSIDHRLLLIIDYYYLVIIYLIILFYLERKWAYGGNSIITPESIRVTPDTKSMSGYIFNTRVKKHSYPFIYFNQLIFTFLQSINQLNFRK